MTPAEIAHNKRIELYARKIRRLFTQAAGETGSLALLPGYDPNKPFSIENYPNAKTKMDKILREVANDTRAIITKGIDTEWYNANKNLDALAYAQAKAKHTIPKEWLQHNEDAREAFKLRQTDGMNLSKRVWKLTEQFKQELELAIDVALSDGRSAAELSRDVRNYLNEPNKLFRRVRNKKTGKLQLSKAAKAYHPGRGVYRSSYKNAMRLARTETNMAYREADHLRYQQLDFVLGFEVHLSNNHPVRDICDDLKGKYPKGFKYVGWHPHCRCFVTAWLMDDKEFNQVEQKLLAGEDISGYQSPNAVKTVPAGMNTWVKQNAARVTNYSKMPYWIRDNFKGAHIDNGLDMDKIVPPVITPAQTGKKVKTEAQRVEIERAWNARVNNRLYSKELTDIIEENNLAGDPSIVIKQHLFGVQNAINQGAYPTTVKMLMENIRKKLAVKKAWDERVLINDMGKVLENPHAAVKQFGLQATKATHDYVKIKLNQWFNLSLTDQVTKLKYEIKYVELTKKQPTWEVAQNAYKKHLVVIEKKLYKEQKAGIIADVNDAMEFALTTKSMEVTKMASEVQTMLMTNTADLAVVKTKADLLIAKVNQLQKRQARKAAKNPKAIATPAQAFSDDVYTQARKDAAYWEKYGNLDEGKKRVDALLRPVTKKIWSTANDTEKHAIQYYTGGSGGFNRPLRGYKQSWTNFKGIGKVSLNEEGQEISIHALTDLINRSTYPVDIWVNRGCSVKNFQGVLGRTIGSDPQSLVGLTFTDPAFVSCGTAKGTGFTGTVKLNIYCPKGSKMIYSEPCSKYGGMDGKIGLWDGKSEATLMYELETVIQRNTTFRIIKVEERYGDYYIDVEIIAQ